MRQSRETLSDEDPESSLAVDFVDYPHDSANTEQAWFALAALAVLLLSLLASMEIIRTEEHNTLDRRAKGQIIIDRVTD